jgi:hypothetical protein
MNLIPITKATEPQATEKKKPFYAAIKQCFASGRSSGNGEKIMSHRVTPRAGN